jgi:hypothetical protein
MVSLSTESVSLKTGSRNLRQDEPRAAHSADGDSDEAADERARDVECTDGAAPVHRDRVRPDGLRVVPATPSLSESAEPWQHKATYE